RRTGKMWSDRGDGDRGEKGDPAVSCFSGAVRPGTPSGAASARTFRSRDLACGRCGRGGIVETRAGESGPFRALRRVKPPLLRKFARRLLFALGPNFREKRGMNTISRREFFSGAAAAAAGTLFMPSAGFGALSGGNGNRAMKIERIEAFPVRYPTVMPFKFFEGAEGTGRAAGITKIPADNGMIGWGESVPVPRWSYETPQASVDAIERYLAPALIGRDPFDIKGAHEAMNREITASFTVGMPITKAGIDL